MKIKNNRFCVDIPPKIYKEIWLLSGYMKHSMVVQCLLVEYLVDPELCLRVKRRMDNRKW